MAIEGVANDRVLVLEHLKKHGTITHDEANELYGMKRLAARINELRNLGFPITTDMVRCKNRRGGISKYAKYTLEVEL